MQPTHTEMIAIGISAAAFVVAAASAAYTRSQARVSERARALEHDASWRVRWQERQDNSAKLQADGMYPLVWVFLVENIGNGKAFDLHVTIGELKLFHGDAGPGWAQGLPADPGDNLRFTWRDRDGRPQKDRQRVPGRPISDV